MNIITKICIVLVALLGVCISVVVARLVITEDNYRELFLAKSADAELSEVRASNATLAQLSTEQDNLRLKRELSVALSDVRREQEGRADDVRRLTTQLTDQQEAVKDLTVKVGNFVEALNLVEQGRGTIVEQHAIALTHIAKLEDELTAADVALQAAQAEIERREGTEKVLLERLAQLQELYDRLKGTAVMPAAVDGEQPISPAPSAAAGPKITGTITAVRDNMASINIGSVKGVREGMTLYVYRDDHFVAHLEIIEVSDTEATGRIFDPRQGEAPQTGDKVTTSLK